MSIGLLAAETAAEEAPRWLWALTIIGAPALIAIDLYVVARIHPRMSTKAAALWSTFWLLLGGAFAFVVLSHAGKTYAIKYTTGYMVEKALTIDQVFVIAVVIATWRTPPTAARRLVLYALSIGLFSRLPFIALGTWLAESDSQLLRVIDGLFFIVGGIYLLVTRNRREDPHHSKGVHLLNRFGEVLPEFRDRRFAVHEDGKRLFTLAAVVLLALVTTDLYFDIGVPLAFAFTKPAFIVLASTLLSMLGMRSLYIFVAGLQVDVTRVRVMLAIILFLVAGDLMLYERIERPTWVVPAFVLGLIVFVLAGAWWRSGTNDEPALDPSAVFGARDLP